MNFFIQKTDKKYRPEIKHPIGKFCLEFCAEPDEFLLEKKGNESYLVAGFPMPNDKIQYYDTKEDAQKRIDTMYENWRSAYKIIEVTKNGLIYV